MPRQPRREQPLPSPHPKPASAAQIAYEQHLEALAAENQAHKQSLARRVEPVLNAYLQTQVPENAEQKKELAQRVSADLKRLGLAIHHPDTEQPCALMAASGKAKRLGFVLLMPKGSKKALSPPGQTVRPAAPPADARHPPPGTARRAPRRRKDGGPA